MMKCNNDKNDDDDDDHVDKWNRKYTYSGCCIPSGWMTNDILYILVRWRKYEWKYFITAKMSSMWMLFFLNELWILFTAMSWMAFAFMYNTPIHMQVWWAGGLLYTDRYEWGEVEYKIKYIFIKKKFYGKTSIYNVFFSIKHLIWFCFNV